MAAQGQNPSETDNPPKGLSYLELFVVLTVSSIVSILCFMPSPPRVYTCSKCGNEIRQQLWTVLDFPERHCLTSHPLSPTCKHPAYAPRKVTMLSQAADMVNRQCDRLERIADWSSSWFH